MSFRVLDISRGCCLVIEHLTVTSRRPWFKRICVLGLFFVNYFLDKFFCRINLVYNDTNVRCNVKG